MKRMGRTWCALASLSLIVIPLVGAEPQNPPRAVAVPEPPPEVNREGRKDLLFGGHRPVPKTEPEVIEIVPEEVARERAKQRARQPEGTVQGTIGPDSTLVIVEQPGVQRIEPKQETRRAGVVSPPATVTGTRTKSSKGTREERAKVESRIVQPSPAPVITGVPPEEAVTEQRSTVTETREMPRRNSTNTVKRTDDSKVEIEQLQKKVKQLENEVAEARREPEKVIVPPAPSTPPTPASTTPLPIPAITKDERQPLVVDTPPPTTAVTTKTETVRTGNTDTLVTSELPEPQTQKTEVATVPPAPKIEPTATSEKISTSEVTATTPKPDADPAPITPPKTEEKITTTTPGKIDKLPTDSDVPVAEKTDKAGYVTSPFPPHKLIDVSGLPKGSLAKDPTTSKIFRVP